MIYMNTNNLIYAVHFIVQLIYWNIKVAVTSFFFQFLIEMLHFIFSILKVL